MLPFATLVKVSLLVSATTSTASPLLRRAAGYNNPADAGGNSLGYFPGNTNGEPLNVIVSGLSSTDVLQISGFTNWYNSIGLGKECFGLHSGDAMHVTIDNLGERNQTGEVRQLYGENAGSEGSCLESLIGGNHFRFWQQQGTYAWFLATSIEEDLSKSHTVEPDGYDKGRDMIVSSAINGSSYNGKTYTATVQYVTGLLPVGSQGINHNVAIDGRTAVLTVTSK